MTKSRHSAKPGPLLLALTARQDGLARRSARALASLEAALVSAPSAAATWSAERARARLVCAPLLELTAPLMTAARDNVAAVERVLTDAVRAALTRLAAPNDDAGSGPRRSTVRRLAPSKSLATARARVAHLEAERLDLKDQVAGGDLWPVVGVEHLWQARVGAARATLLNLPVSLADKVHRAAVLGDADAVTRAMASALEEALRELGAAEPHRHSDAEAGRSPDPRALAIARRVRALWAPPPQRLVSEFADAEIIVTSGPLAGTHWQTSFAPYQRGIQDVFHEPGVEIAVVMGSSQWGKTSIAVNVVCFHVSEDPSAALVVEPTVDPMARDFARNRLNPVIDASPTLKACMTTRRQGGGGNAILARTFRGGDLAIGGANSAASLAARSRRLLILDEIDRYPPELPGEGSTIAVAIKRTSAYRRRRRVLMLSSPTLVGAPIDRWFRRGDQRRYYVPCPACGHMHTLKWANIRWTDEDPATAHLICPACAHTFGDAERVAILSRGEWRAENPDRREKQIVSFHMWEAYSPLSSLAEIVSAFLVAKRARDTGDRSELHTWQNTTLGEPIEPDDGEGVEPHTLLLRRESYGDGIEAPAGVVAITLGVDVQDDRLELLVIGWGPGEESWLLDRAEIPGDTSRPEPWDNLSQALSAEYRGPDGLLPISATCIDSGGHRTSEVYDYVHKNGARRVFATIGRDGQRPIVSSPSPRKWGRGARQVRLFTLGVDTAKALLMSRLALSEKGPGYVHIPHADWADEELAAQLTSERLITRWHRGVPVTAWKKTRPRNEMLDAAILAHAALRLLNPRLAAPSSRAEADLAAARAGDGPTRAPWLPRRKGWLSQ